MSDQQITKELTKKVGSKYVLSDKKKTASYTKGFRYGQGEALAVVIPGSLLEMWEVTKYCVEKDIIIIFQAANTGLTGGSTPYGDYDRPVVILSTTRLTGIQLVNQGEQVIALPGSRLYELEKALDKYGREPHSVIGSSCIGASVVGGVCNNSGGALIQRGPAYTELSLYAQINENQELELVNKLGIDLGDSPEEILANLEAQSYPQSAIKQSDLSASDKDYQERVRAINEETPSRFNNDGRKLYDASGCAGKLVVFAVRLDTFKKPEKEQVFYIGTNQTETLTLLRRHILEKFENLPVSGEYIHRDYFDVSDKYGKDSFLVIKYLGSQFMPKLFALKGKVDRSVSKLKFMPTFFSDKVLQSISKVFPNHLPKKMRAFRDDYEHHLILHMSGEGVDEAKGFLEELFKSSDGGFFECSDQEAKSAFNLRFVAAGGAKRYHAMHRKSVGGLIALDIALKRNEKEWFETLPKEIDDMVELKLYCGHFFCHVMHQDYILKKDANEETVKNLLLKQFDEKGAEYPAEHNVGQLYLAKSALRNFYQKCDPTNSLNPGIGKTPKGKNWKSLGRESY